MRIVFELANNEDGISGSVWTRPGGGFMVKLIDDDAQQAVTTFFTDNESRARTYVQEFVLGRLQEEV